MSVHLTRDPDGTREAGRLFASALVPGDVVTLSGTLGSGKTHFTMGVCESMPTSESGNATVRPSAVFVATTVARYSRFT